MPFASGYATWFRPESKRVENGIKLSSLDPVAINGKTLGEVIQNYERQFSVEIKPAEGIIDEESDHPKFWVHSGPPRRFCESGIEIIDIHIERDGKIICPKQNLDFVILENDIIHIPAQFAC